MDLLKSSIVNKLIQSNKALESRSSDLFIILNKTSHSQIDKLIDVARKLVSDDDINKLITDTVNSVVIPNTSNKNIDFSVADVDRYYIRNLVAKTVNLIEKQLIIEYRKLIRTQCSLQSKQNEEPFKQLLIENVNDSRCYLSNECLRDDELLGIYNFSADVLGKRKCNKISQLIKTKLVKELFVIDKKDDTRIFKLKAIPEHENIIV